MLFLLAALLWSPIPAVPGFPLPPQEAGVLEEVRVRSPDGAESFVLSVSREKGFAAFPVGSLRELGWRVDPVGSEESEGEEEVTGGGTEEVRLRWREGGPLLVLRPGNPFFFWGEDGVQLTSAPYRARGELFLPVQFLVDILPWKLPEAFAWDPQAGVLSLVDERSEEEASSGPKVVVIDPGHGGRDPGAMGVRGTREKDVALGIARALGRILAAEPDLEVYMTREDDRLVPLWKRGEEATRWKGEAPGVFLSIHANALPGSRSTRGFETYFLSEARTEHERRVAALENAAMEMEEEEEWPGGQNPDLSFILTELRNLDHQHWSALLAELVQEKMEQVHPGPDRGVKQGPLAVITNALMPAVLIEVGFLTNPDEERLLVQRSFQENAARAVARAVREFFRRYPPEGRGE